MKIRLTLIPSVSDYDMKGMPEGVGDDIDITVELITPIAMEEELRFAIREGGRTVGAGAVVEVLE